MPSSFCGEANLFGIRVAVQSDHAAALQTALSALLEGNNPAFDSSSQSVSIALVAEQTNPTPSLFRVVGKQLEIAKDGIALEADGEHGLGTCRFAPAAGTGELLEDAVRTTALFLVAQAGRVPVHASAVIIGDWAVVLAGRSGTGKSSLALAASRKGLPVLSEDTVFVQTDPTFRVWGLGGAIHLLEQDAPYGSCTRIRSGRVKRAVPIVRHQSRADNAILCVLQKGETARLEEFDQQSAVRLLTEAPEPGYEFYGSRMENAIRAVADGGCWKLTLSKNADEAITALVAAFSNRDATRRTEASV